jgi:adenosine deaminase
VAMRTGTPREAVAVALAAADARDLGVVGFDLAGPEAAAPHPLRFAAAFATAREAGLALTCHAGEWGGPRQVRAALELAPARIAHGAVAVSDHDLVSTLRDRRVTLDLCPTSNIQAGTFGRLADHPLPHLLRAGVPVTLSTDDRTVSDLDLVEEYHRAIDVLGLTSAELLATARHAYRAAFLQHDEALRERLLSAFDRWVEVEPVPGGAEAPRSRPAAGPAAPRS